MDNKKINIDPQFGKLIEPQINKDKVIDNLKEEIEELKDKNEYLDSNRYDLLKALTVAYLVIDESLSDSFCCHECREAFEKEVIENAEAELNA